MNSFKRTHLEELRVRASILLKDLRSDDDARRQKAASRFQKLPFTAHSSTQSILADVSFFRLKHAQQVLAVEHGHTSWQTLRAEIIRQDCLFGHASSSFLNAWFSNYAEARQYQESHGGYLLSYRKDFAVCGEDFIESIGLAGDPDWQAIGCDWVKPADIAAWNRLFVRARAGYLSKRPALKPIDRSRRPAWTRME